MRLGEYVGLVRRMDWGQLRHEVDEVHARSGKGRLATFADMVACSRAYEAGFNDYYLLHFEDLTPAQRATYITRGVNQRYIRALNDRAYYHYFEDKVEFLEHFSQFVRREWIDLTCEDADELGRFLARHPSVVAKPVGLSGGFGVERIDADATTDVPALYARLREQGKTLVEECLRQHPEMDRICPASVNTLRIVTILKDDEVHVMLRSVRFGNGVNHVDNLHSGGMYCFFDEDGVITCDAADRQDHDFERHPATGVAFRGFRIPLAREAVEMACRAARVVPQVGYVGFDVAITPDGPELVEGNDLPGYDIYQSAPNIGPDGLGAKPRFDAVVFGDGAGAGASA